MATVMGVSLCENDEQALPNSDDNKQDIIMSTNKQRTMVLISNTTHSIPHMRIRCVWFIEWRVILLIV